MRRWSHIFTASSSCQGPVDSQGSPTMQCRHQHCAQPVLALIVGNELSTCEWKGFSQFALTMQFLSSVMLLGPPHTHTHTHSRDILSCLYVLGQLQGTRKFYNYPVALVFYPFMHLSCIMSQGLTEQRMLHHSYRMYLLDSVFLILLLLNHSYALSQQPKHFISEWSSMGQMSCQAN